MKQKKMHKVLNNSAVTGVLESLVAVGIVVTLVAIFSYSLTTTFVVQKDPAVDLKVKCNGIMNSLIGSSGQDNYLRSNWDEEGQYTAFGLCTTPTVEYGIINKSSSGQVTIVNGPYPNQKIGLDKTCFIAGTKVVMADDNYRNIEDIKVGDLVKCYDEKKNIVTNGIVKEVFHHLPEEMSDYYLLINEKLGVTPNHQFYINGQWVYAMDLKIGDSLFGTGFDYQIFSIEKIFEKKFTYNFEVEGNHNYFIKIDKNEALVHNGGTPSVITINLIADSYEGQVPWTPKFSCSASGGTKFETGGDYNFYWDCDGDGIFDVDYNPIQTDSPSEVSYQTYNFAGVVYNVKVKVVDKNGIFAEAEIQVTTYGKDEGTRPGFIATDIDGLGEGKIFFFRASPVLAYESSDMLYNWYIDDILKYSKNENTLFHQFYDDNPHTVKLVITFTNKTSSYYAYNGSTVIKTVQANKVGPFEEELKSWILTGKNVYPSDNYHNFLSFDNNYYIKYTLTPSVGAPGAENIYYLYEIKEKTSSDYPILDFTKIENISKFDETYLYNTLRESMGLSSKYTLYNFAVEIEISGDSKIYSIGAIPDNVYAQESQTRKIQVYYPPKASADGKSISTHPYYRSGEITVYLFIGPSGL